MNIDTQSHASEAGQETEHTSNLLREWIHGLGLPTPEEMKAENDQVRLERALVHQREAARHLAIAGILLRNLPPVSVDDE